MGTRSLALFDCLLSDLGVWLPTLVPPGSENRSRIEPWPDISTDAVACIQLLNSILKKFQEEKSGDADEKALRKFLESNEKCRLFRWPDASSLTTLDTVAIGETKSLLWDFFFPVTQRYTFFQDQEILDRADVGPGASRSATGDSFYHKVAASPLTGTTRALLRLYKSEVRKFPLWLETEKIRSSHYEEFRVVAGNKLSFVAKTTEISRTICTEPLLNMWFQKGIGSLLEHWLERRWAISLATQPDKNRELARQGSIDGSFGTIDLSSASDSISLAMLQELLPADVMAWLELTRSPMTELPDGSKVALHMVSSMGNAFTFPLQTILFAAIVQGAYRALDIPVRFPRKQHLGNFAVFGDDIIVAQKAYGLVCRLLSYFGFTVNADKSFNEGPFRESCGSDYWSGTDVRGVYCQGLSSKHEVYSLINRLNVWSANHLIPLPCTIQYLAGLVRFIPVPPWETDTAGIKVPWELAYHHRTKRSKNTGSVLYQRYVPRIKGFDLRNVGLAVKLNRRVIINRPGIVLAAVSGRLRDGSVVERQRRVHYQYRYAVSPCWDFWHPGHSRLTSDGWRAWVTTFAALNLGKV